MEGVPDPILLSHFSSFSTLPIDNSTKRKSWGSKRRSIKEWLTPRPMSVVEKYRRSVIGNSAGGRGAGETGAYSSSPSPCASPVPGFQVPLIRVDLDPDVDADVSVASPRNRSRSRSISRSRHRWSRKASQDTTIASSTTCADGNELRMRLSHISRESAAQDSDSDTETCRLGVCRSSVVYGYPGASTKLVRHYGDGSDSGPAGAKVSGIDGVERKCVARAGSDESGDGRGRKRVKEQVAKRVFGALNGFKARVKW